MVAVLKHHREFFNLVLCPDSQIGCNIREALIPAHKPIPCPFRLLGRFSIVTLMYMLPWQLPAVIVCKDNRTRLTVFIPGCSIAAYRTYVRYGCYKGFLSGIVVFLSSGNLKVLAQQSDIFFFCPFCKEIVIGRFSMNLYFTAGRQLHFYIRSWRDICLHCTDNHLIVCVTAKGRSANMYYIVPDLQSADLHCFPTVIVSAVGQHICSNIGNTVRQNQCVLV